ncbi:hypothetical protein [Bacillus cereus]|uniref:hypothetical protein n=1 Tax=Bacillus cereus group TaxID=86661 RepID=UPI00077A65B5|nr:hypothetical protein [Bacillus cereus]KXY54984.1 hypothetical protein AT275_23210 [Bacillus cereus]
MSWTNTFIESLKEWDEHCNPKDATLKDVLFFLSYNIGEKLLQEDLTVESLKKRIIYLVNEESFEEKFLIDSLIHETTAIFKKRINELGEGIIRNERGKETFEKNGQDASNFERQLSKMKNMQYIYMVENQLDVWNTIVNQKFSLSNRRQLEMEDFQRNYEELKRQKGFSEGIPDEYKDVPFSDLYKK